MRPAVIITAPDGSSTVVSDLRTFMPGTAMLPMRIWFSGSTSVTSVATRKLIRPSASTTGVKLKVTPYGLYSTPIAQDLRPPTVVQSSLLGIGISPPAVNLADSPEIAVSVGSARTRETPARSNACKVADAENPPREMLAVSRLPGFALGFSGKG